MIELILGVGALLLLTKKKTSPGTTTTTQVQPKGKKDQSGKTDIYSPPNNTTDRTMVVNYGTTQGSGVNTQQSAGSGKRNRPNAV